MHMDRKIGLHSRMRAKWQMGRFLMKLFRPTHTVKCLKAHATKKFLRAYNGVEKRHRCSICVHIDRPYAPFKNHQRQTYCVKYSSYNIMIAIKVTLTYHSTYSLSFVLRTCMCELDYLIVIGCLRDR